MRPCRNSLSGFVKMFPSWKVYSSSSKRTEYLPCHTIAWQRVGISYHHYFNLQTSTCFTKEGCIDCGSSEAQRFRPCFSTDIGYRSSYDWMLCLCSESSGWVSNMSRDYMWHQNVCMLPGAPRQTEHRQSTRHLWLGSGKTAEQALLSTVLAARSRSEGLGGLQVAHEANGGCLCREIRSPQLCSWQIQNLLC